MIKRLVLLATSVVVLLLLAAFFLPTQVVVERSTLVARPAATVFTLLNGFSSYPNWLPWMRLDPNLSLQLSGPAQGPGARLSWSGDPSLVGVGWQEIVQSEPYTNIMLTMDIADQGMASSEYLIEGDQLGSRLTWRFKTDLTEGQGFLSGLLGRYFGLFLKSWVERDYERGLAAFKTYAESLPAHDFSNAEIEVVDVSAEAVLVVAGEALDDPQLIAAKLAEAYTEIMDVVARESIQITGQPMTITSESQGGQFSYQAAIPVSVDSGPGSNESRGRVVLGQSPHGKAVRIVHRGSYAQTLTSYQQATAWMAANGIKPSGLSWEHYITDPGVTPDAELVTHLYFLLEQ